MSQAENPQTDGRNEELETWLNILQEGYYWGLLRKVEGQEWEDHLAKGKRETQRDVNETLTDH